MRIVPNALRSIRVGLACVWMAVGAAAFAVDSPSTGFAGSLSPNEKAASGVSLLSPAQTAALDAQVARDVSLAREGDVSGFSTTFLQRSTAAERAAAGLNRLSAGQRSRLDSLVARAIATPPFGEANFVYRANPVSPIVPIEPKSLEIHGDLSFTVGGGKGGSFYGTSMEATVSDPDGRFSLTIGYSTYHGKGLFYPGPLLTPDCSPFGPPYPPFGPLYPTISPSFPEGSPDR